LNKKKSEFFIRKIKYLGHVISSKGLETDPEKMEAILNTPAPMNLKELQSFLGMLQFYANFIPHLSTKLKALHQLLNKNSSFHWSKECNTAFNQIKRDLTEAPVLTTYDPQLPLYLETDASPYRLGAILLHKIDGVHKSIAFYLHTLTKAEKNYTHTKREATAIFWATKKLYQFLYGRLFTLITDNKPLQLIFNGCKDLPSIASQRLLRYALHLRQFEYNIKYHLGNLHVNVDYLSRQPIANINPDFCDEGESIFEASIKLI